MTAPLPARPVQPGAPPPLPLLPGEFALETWVGSGVIDDAPAYGPGTPHYLTAVNGGGQQLDAVHIDATQVASWERFKLVVAGNGQFGIQTSRGYNLLSYTYQAPTFPAPPPVGHVESDAKGIGDLTKFRLLQQPTDSGTYTIMNSSGYYISAETYDGAIHVDSLNNGNTEKWRLVKAGDVGFGSCYGIQAFTGFFLSAPGGGGRTTDAILAVSPAMGPLHSPERFRLMGQSDGTYALQTANGANYVTAVNGGGLVQSSTTWNILQTNRTQVQAWEKFRFADQGDGTYAIQTVSGYYLGLYRNSSGTFSFTTDRSTIGPGEKFKLIWCDPLS